MDAWFLTHVHDDHCEALTGILRDPQDLKVNALYASLPDEAWFEKVCDVSELLTYKALATALADSGHSFTPLAPGDTLEIDGISIRVLGGCNPEIVKNPINNSSMVLRFSDAQKSVLFLGDLGVEGGRKLLQSLKPPFSPPTMCRWPTTVKTASMKRSTGRSTRGTASGPHRNGFGTTIPVRAKTPARGAPRRYGDGWTPFPFKNTT